MRCKGRKRRKKSLVVRELRSQRSDQCCLIGEGVCVGGGWPAHTHPVFRILIIKVSDVCLLYFICVVVKEMKSVVNVR